MTSSSDAPLSNLSLGDVTVLPDGRAMTIRAQVTLPFPAGSMAGFIIAGEMDVLLSIPASMHQPGLIYVPVDYLPESAENSRVVCEGATNYWAPHLPALQGAMGEVLYRAVLVRGSVDPIVIVYRGPEVIVFIRAAIVNLDELSVLSMARNVANQVEVPRHVALVSTPSTVPSYVDLPEDTPASTGAGTGRRHR